MITAAATAAGQLNTPAANRPSMTTTINMNNTNTIAYGGALAAAGPVTLVVVDVALEVAPQFCATGMLVTKLTPPLVR